MFEFLSGDSWFPRRCSHKVQPLPEGQINALLQRFESGVQSAQQRIIHISARREYSSDNASQPHNMTDITVMSFGRQQLFHQLPIYTKRESSNTNQNKQRNINVSYIFSIDPIAGNGKAVTIFFCNCSTKQSLEQTIQR